MTRNENDVVDEILGPRARVVHEAPSPVARDAAAKADPAPVPVRESLESLTALARRYRLTVILSGAIVALAVVGLLTLPPGIPAATNGLVIQHSMAVQHAMDVRMGYLMVNWFMGLVFVVIGVGAAILWRGTEREIREYHSGPAKGANP